MKAIIRKFNSNITIKDFVILCNLIMLGVLSYSGMDIKSLGVKLVITVFSIIAVTLSVYDITCKIKKAIRSIDY